MDCGGGTHRFLWSLIKCFIKQSEPLKRIFPILPQWTLSLIVCQPDFYLLLGLMNENGKYSLWASAYCANTVWGGSPSACCQITPTLTHLFNSNSKKWERKEILLSREDFPEKKYWQYILFIYLPKMRVLDNYLFESLKFWYNKSFVRLEGLHFQIIRLSVSRLHWGGDPRS